MEPLELEHFQGMVDRLSRGEEISDAAIMGKREGSMFMLVTGAAYDYLELPLRFSRWVRNSEPAGINPFASWEDKIYPFFNVHDEYKGPDESGFHPTFKIVP